MILYSVLHLIIKIIIIIIIILTNMMHANGCLYNQNRNNKPFQLKYLPLYDNLLICIHESFLVSTFSYEFYQKWTLNRHF